MGSHAAQLSDRVVLVVDDEDVVRQYVARTMTEAGSGWSARDGEEAATFLPDPRPGRDRPGHQRHRHAPPQRTAACGPDVGPLAGGAHPAGLRAGRPAGRLLRVRSSPTRSRRTSSSPPSPSWYPRTPASIGTRRVDLERRPISSEPWRALSEEPAAVIDRVPR